MMISSETSFISMEKSEGYHTEQIRTAFLLGQGDRLMTLSEF